MHPAIAIFRSRLAGSAGSRKKVTLGTEIFYHGPEGLATPQTRPATLIDVGGYYKFRDPDFSSCSVMAHRIGKPKTTLTSVCIGLG